MSSRTLSSPSTGYVLLYTAGYVVLHTGYGVIHTGYVGLHTGYVVLQTEYVVIHTGYVVLHTGCVLLPTGPSIPTLNMCFKQLYTSSPIYTTGNTLSSASWIRLK